MRNSTIFRYGGYEDLGAKRIKTWVPIWSKQRMEGILLRAPEYIHYSVGAKERVRIHDAHFTVQRI